MARLAMAYIKTENGMKLFAPLDAEDESLIGNKTVIISEMVGNKAARTTLQNRSIHKYCALLAEAFESSGLDMQEVLSKAVPVRWTMEAVKEVIWKRIQVVMYPDKPSTTQLETKDVNEVYQVISRHMATEFNIKQSFPNRHRDDRY